MRRGRTEDSCRDNVVPPLTCLVFSLAQVDGPRPRLCPETVTVKQQAARQAGIFAPHTIHMRRTVWLRRRPREGSHSGNGRPKNNGDHCKTLRPVLASANRVSLALSLSSAAGRQALYCTSTTTSTRTITSTSTVLVLVLVLVLVQVQVKYYCYY